MSSTNYSEIIKKYIEKQSSGWVFSAQDLLFLDINYRTISVILHRLSKNGLIRRLGYGLYDVPRKSTLFDDFIPPNISDIIDAYSRRRKQVFVLEPNIVANMFGFTTQVPTKLMYLTDGTSKVLTICGLKIYFIHASPKTLKKASWYIRLGEKLKMSWNIHPGEILREEFMEPYGLDAHKLSKLLNIPFETINDIVNEKRAINAKIAVKLAHYFNTTPQFWLNMQRSSDLKRACA